MILPADITLHAMIYRLGWTPRGLFASPHVCFTESPTSEVAIAGKDGQRAADLLGASKRAGTDLLATLTEKAVRRLLAMPNPSAVPVLFDDDELEQLRESLAATIATADLLGRSRVRQFVKRMEAREQAGAAKFAEPKGDGPPGPPPRPGLTWKPETSRWVRPDGTDHDGDQPAAKDSPESDAPLEDHEGAWEVENWIDFGDHRTDIEDTHGDPDLFQGIRQDVADTFAQQLAHKDDYAAKAGVSESPEYISGRKRLAKAGDSYLAAMQQTHTAFAPIGAAKDDLEVLRTSPLDIADIPPPETRADVEAYQAARRQAIADAKVARSGAILAATARKNAAVPAYRDALRAMAKSQRAYIRAADGLADVVAAKAAAAGKVETFAEPTEPDDPFGIFPEPIPFQPPEAAARYFGNLVPSLANDPFRYGPLLERHAFTLAVATDQALLDKVKRAIGERLLGLPGPGASIGTATADIQDILDAAGVAPANPQYAEQIFRTNCMDAYNHGQMAELQDPVMKEFFPVWRYEGIRDGRQGKDHEPKFDKYYPSTAVFADVRGPRVWNCRCCATPIYRTEWAELQARGARLESSW